MTASSSRAAALSAAVVVNAGAALQARVNGDLGSRLADGAVAALVSTGVGLVLLSVLAAVHAPLRAGLRRLLDDVRAGLLPWYFCLGGVCGGFFVAVQALTVPTLGVALFTLAVVAGTSVGSLLVDARGWGPTGRLPLTRARVIGSVVVVAAVGLGGAERMTTASGAWLLGLPLLGGAVIAWQTGANGLVRVRSGSAAAATWLNFAFAVASLLPVVLLDRAVRAASGHPFVPPGWPTSVWAYTGGVIGMSLIAAATLLVQRTGVLLFGLAAVAGQVLGALALDVVAGSERPDAVTLLAAVLTVVGVAVAAAGRDRPRSTPAEDVLDQQSAETVHGV